MKRAICIILAVSLCLISSARGELGLHTVAIDAGHGGKDPGCVSRDRRTYEKDLALDIARKLSSRISEAYPDIKVVQTRPKDEYVTVGGRAVLANKEDADLFISIHINAAPSASAHGYSVHVLGQSRQHDLLAYNLTVCARENSVITLEDDYSTKYEGFDPSDPESFIFMQLMQNAYLEQSMNFAQCISQHLAPGPIKTNRGISQDPFLLLWKTSMPAVLVELGFISNDSDVAVLRDATNRDKLADCLFAAFSEYKKNYDSSLSLKPVAEHVEEAQAAGCDTAGSNLPPVGPTAAGSNLPPVGPTAVGSNLPPERGTEGVEKSKDASASEDRVSGTEGVEKSKDPVDAVSCVYGVQIFAGSSRIPEGDRQFLGYRPTVVGNGKIYKYVIGTSSSIDEVKAILPEIKKTYPQAFLVRVEGGSTIAEK